MLLEESCVAVQRAIKGTELQKGAVVQIMKVAGLRFYVLTVLAVACASGRVVLPKQHASAELTFRHPLGYKSSHGLCTVRHNIDWY